MHSGTRNRYSSGTARRVFGACLALLSLVMIASAAAPGRTSATALRVGREYGSAFGFAAGPGVVAGAAQINGLEQPALWEGGGRRFRTLPIAGGTIRLGVIRATDGAEHAGFQYRFDFGRGIQRNEATVWRDDTFVNLHDPAWEFSDAYAVSGGVVGGLATLPSGVTAATLWTGGSADSAVSLHPEGAASSVVFAMAPGVQVGVADYLQPDNSYLPRAIVWGGTAESFADVTPADVDGAVLRATDGASHAGSVLLGGAHHAALWSGASFVGRLDEPEGATSSEAHAVRGALQAGFATGADALPRAVAWRDGALFDLHASLPAGYAYSYAYAITDRGEVVGQAYDESTGTWSAIVWRLPGR